MRVASFSQLTLYCKVYGQKKAGSGRGPAGGPIGGWFSRFPGRVRFGERVADDLLQLSEVVQEPLPATGRQPAKRLRPSVFKAFPDFHQASRVQDFKVPIQVAVGERTELLEFPKPQP